VHKDERLVEYLVRKVADAAETLLDLCSACGCKAVEVSSEAFVGVRSNSGAMRCGTKLVLRCVELTAPG